MKSIYIPVLGLLLFGCSDIKDYYASINERPVLEFAKASGSDKTYIEDSLKIGYKYATGYTVKDEEKLALKIVSDADCSVTDNGSTLEFTAFKEGLEIITVHVIDSYGMEASGIIKLTVFNNLSPVPQMSYTVTQLDDSYYLTMDASLSYDKDAKFGGKVTSYEFTINNFKIQQDVPVLNYSVNKDAVYTVKIRVKDNNNAWSTYLVTYIKI